MPDLLILLIVIVGLVGFVLVVVAIATASHNASRLREMDERWIKLSGRVHRLEQEAREGPAPDAREEVVLIREEAQPEAPLAPDTAPPAEERVHEGLTREHAAEHRPLPSHLKAALAVKREATDEPEREWVSEAEPADEPAVASWEADVGGEAQPEPGPTAAEQWAKWEDIIGKQWMTWAGAAAMFLAAAFFVKYAYDQGWLGRVGPMVRISIGVLFGLGLTGAGVRFLNRGMRAFGQGLVGAGIAIVYVSLFAGYHFYPEQMSQTMAFLLLVLACAGGMALAVIYDALPIAVLATLGGFMTPIMVSTGHDARDALFTYLTLLDVGVVGVALFKRWFKLSSIAFAGTWILFAGWHAKFSAGAAMGPTVAWIAVFYFIFLALPFVYHLRHGENTTVGQFVLSLLHATLTFTYLWQTLGGYDAGRQHVLGACAIGMSACYMAMGAAFRKRVPSDGRALFGFIALAVVFLTLAIPCHLGLQGITFAWAIEAAALVNLGYRYRYRPVRFGGFALLLLTGARIAARHWPLHAGAFAPFFNRDFATALALPVSAWAYAFIHHWRREAGTPADRQLKLISAIGAGFAACVLVHAELASWLGLRHRPDLVQCAAPMTWAVGAWLFMLAGVKLRSVHSRGAALASLAIALAFGSALQFAAVHGKPMLFLSPRFLCSLFVVATVFGLAWIYRRFKDLCTSSETGFASALWIGAGCLLLIVLSFDMHRAAVEAFESLARARWVADTSITVLWALGAGAFLYIGFQTRSLAARSAAVVVAVVSAVMALHLYFLAEPPACWLLVSPRFLATSFVIAVGASISACLCTRSDVCTGEEQTVGAFLAWAVPVLLWLNLSVEVYTHFTHSISDPARARWVAHMSLSITWAAYAAALLCIGFWRRIQPLRFVALGLFGLTALKLIFVDMATVEKIYRILAFFGIGLLFWVAGYLYHRLEQRIVGGGGGE